MIDITDNGGRWYAKLVFSGGGSYDDYDGGANIYSVSVTSYAQSGEALAIGCAVSASVTVKMEEASGLQGQTLSLYLGQAADSSVTWYPMGVYTVTETEVQDGVLTFTARDAMYFLGGTYSPGEAVQSTCTLADALSDLCAQANITLASDVPAVSFGGVPDNLTYSTALAYLAALAGCNARFDREGKLVLSWYTDSGVTLTADDYYSGGLTVKLADITVCALSVTVETTVSTTNDDGTTTEENSTVTIDRTADGSGEGISITNPLFTEDNVSTAWGVVQGFIYRPATVSAIGQPTLEPGDVVEVTQNGNTYLVPVMCHTLDYDGGLKSTITAEGTCAAEQSGAASGGPLAEQISSIQTDIANFKRLYAENIEAQRLVVSNLENEVSDAGSKALSLQLTSEYQGISCASDGTISTLPTVQTIATAQYGSTDVTDSCTWSVTETDCSGSWDDDSHTYTLTALDADTASVTIAATYLGVTASKVFSVSKIYNGADGEDGVTISSSSVTYQVGDDGTTPPEGEWTEGIPEAAEGQYLWTRTVTTYTDGSESVSYSVAYQGLNGKDGTDGDDGKDGADGRGISGTSVSYQASSSGTTPPTGTWQSTVPTVSEGQYLWTRTIYTFTDGTTQTVYSVGYTGTNGTDGTSVGGVTNYYLASASSSGVTTSTSGWTTETQTISSSKPYLWNYEVVKDTDGNTISITEPTIIGHFGTDGTNGENGVSITSITEHYAVSSSNTTAPTTWQDNEVPTMTATNKYLWNYETIYYSDDSHDDTLKRVIGAYGDTGADGADGKDGADGSDGTDATTYYIISSCSIVTRDVDTTTLTPSKVTFTFYSKTGDDDPVLYSDGYYK